ncbi:S-layer homology domain-containing protein [Paenibacillus sp. PR3]|uniref:S-layer homology domain-containing protein n=1 Tax=Paenibacillus terricola TaxID=2763503 RepID=A0ABR8N0J7_9BACL|nr:S-layer homology domain-containing protein [Paenibacillus terricola]MBD3921678.1 S-layer homology domain-containing protein [Paenibacillus terricola]
MKNSMRRSISLMVALLVMIMTVAAPVSAMKLQDSQSHWAQAAIDKWSGYGVVQGSGGNFRPNDQITRAEFATMVNNIMKYTDKGDNPFSDVKSEAWYADALIKLSTADVMNGVNGKALPNNEITRQEAAVMLFNAFHISAGSNSASFADSGDIAAWAKDAVASLAGQKVINGMPDGSFKPQAHLTRAEAVTIFNNLIQDLVNASGEHTGDVQGNVVVNAAGAELKDMKISGDLYITEGVGEGEVTLSNVQIEGSVFVEGGGEHSVIFNSVDVNGALVVNKYNGKVRILATGSTSVSVTRLESGALLVTKELTGGGFETVEIPADVAAGQEIVLDGTFNKVVNQSATAEITANGSIKELVTETDTNLKGNVKVEKVTNQNGSSASVNDKPVTNPTDSSNNTGGSTPSTGTPSTGGSNGGSTGGNGGNGDNGGNGGGTGGSTTVAVDGVSIQETNVKLSVGNTKQLTATVTPSNATNKDVTWSVLDNSDVVTVDQKGLVTAKKAGSATVKVVTVDGAKSAQTTITVSEEVFTDILDAIDAVYLSNNTDASNIVSNLNLVTSLSAFPDAVIAWSSDNESVVSNSGVVTRDNQNDRFVNLTVTVTGSVTATKTYELIVRRNGTDNVSTGNYVDSYFAEGYPQAYMKDGEIWVRYKLNAPAELYMVVNQMNGHWESDVKAVLEGHAGKGNDLIYVDKWPYFNVDSTKVNTVQEFNTGVRLESYQATARVEFVIKDASHDYVSSQVTSIVFDQEVVSSLDTYPPSLYQIYINKALDTMYLYYGEHLDSSSVPATTEFTLTHGQISKVELVNSTQQYGVIGAYLKLAVSGIKSDDLPTLGLTYSGTSVQDESDARNKATAFTNRQIDVVDESIQLAVISSDRQWMQIEIKPGLNPYDNDSNVLMDNARYTIRVNGQEYHPTNVNSGYSINRYYFYLSFDNPIPAGELSVSLNMQGVKGWTMDMYPDSLETSVVKQIEAPGTPTASYNHGSLRLQFAKGFEQGYQTSAAGLVVRVDGVEYALRGFIVRPDWNTPEENDYTINLLDQYAEHIINAIESGKVVEIKFVKTNGNNRAQLSESSGLLIPDFNYVTVTK